MRGVKNMSKGISAIIATILLLLITIALAGTAYMFVSGMLGSRTTKSITVLSATCADEGDGTNEITLVVSNDGTQDIAANGITVVVDGAIDSTLNGFGAIGPHTSAVDTSDSDYASEYHKVIVSGPSNSVEADVYCP
jgi:flagellin-like protein